MYRKALIIICAISLLLTLQCSDTGVKPDPIDPPELTPAQKEIITASNSFAFNIFKEIVNNESDANIFISPLSISYALGMTYNGAEDETKEAMADVLGFDGMDDFEINESYRDLTKALMTIDPEVIMEIANSIWYRQGFEVEQEFIDLNQEYFDAYVAALNFNNPGAKDIINDWIEEKTHDKIQDVIKQIDPLTMMFLVNCIYFKAAWKYEFDPDYTEVEDFHLPSGATVDCDMMHQENELLRYFNDNFQAVQLPYGEAGFCMSIFLPRQGNALDDLINQMDDDSWSDWMGNFKADTTIIKMPKFRLKYDRELKPDLAALGMGIAFEPYEADFTRINNEIDLHITSVLHSTFVQVDEEGTEAAAVTVVEIGTTSIDPNEKLMHINRPFFFVIHDQYTDAILFMGKIANPVWEN
ncbi:MAG: serpin family protein [Aliifodinibius sp.]|nr:serpin family protein [candidate division Zixibacteria bacterium]NIT58943.1 serpin family protein [Fodinibius sp.]NIW39943.1 serpin family protein [candidate division Zixibacteria bacterium]NIY27526.1 serpin family protein [Fodinibius sp.]